MFKKDSFGIFSYLTASYIALMAVYLVLFSDYIYIVDVKMPFFYAVCGGYVALNLVLLAGLTLFRRLSVKAVFKKLMPDSLLQIFLLLYLAFSFVSAILSKYPATWLGATRKEGMLTIALYVLCFYFVSKFVKPCKWTIYLFGLAVCVCCVISIIQLCGSDFLYPLQYNYYDAYKEYTGAFIGTIGNVDFAAAFFALCIPVFSFYAFKATEKTRFLLLIPAVLSLGVLLKLWVLLGVIGVFSSFVICIPCALGFKKRGNIIYWLSATLFAIAGLLTVYFMPFSDGMLGEIHNILHGNISETFGTGRIHIWSGVLERVPDNFLFGTGPDTMAYAKIEPFRRIDENYGEIIANVDTAHNEYLNILFHQGIFAFISYVLAVITVFVRFFKTANNNRGALIFGAGAIGYVVAALFGISVPFSAPFFWLCLGIFERCSNPKNNY